MLLAPIDQAELQLRERRARVQAALARTDPASPTTLRTLLEEIDGALDRIATGSFGRCETCHDPIDPDRLLRDPLVRFCVDHLTPPEQRALEQDLELAARIQAGLLPQPESRHGIWHFARSYHAAGPVSGDYCDLIAGADGSVYFLLGDVSGKGVAASMLMAHLHAMFRTLVSVGLPLDRMFERASALFCESTPASHYATLIGIRADAQGGIEVANAGHPPALIAGRAGITPVEATGLPLGMFCAESFTVYRRRLEPGETLLVYSDGLTEARNRQGEEFGVSRLTTLLSRHRDGSVPLLLERCLGDLSTFQDGLMPQDDLTLVAVRRVG